MCLCMQAYYIMQDVTLLLLPKLTTKVVKNLGNCFLKIVISNKYDKKLTFDGGKLPVTMGYTLHYHIRYAM